MNNIKRICVVGAPGTGKTTLSRKLAEIYNLPVCHLDSFHQLPNWELRDEKERDNMILEETKKDKWILDGTFTNTLLERVNRADLVIFLDYTSFAALKGVIKRIIKDHGKEKPDMPGCKEKFDMSFILYVATYNKQRRNIILDILHKGDKDKLLVFKDVKELNNWVSKLENNA